MTVREAPESVFLSHNEKYSLKVDSILAVIIELSCYGVQDPVRSTMASKMHTQGGHVCFIVDGRNKSS
jgi:hypothetical protein